MLISLIAAMSENQVIGNQGNLPWEHIPADWDNLFRVTAGKKMIMGRKSYESPQRIWSKEGNIVISRQENLPLDKGFELVHSLKEAFDLYKNEAEVFVLGGEEIFKQALPYCNYLYLTIVHQTFEGDAFFPPFDESKFKIIEKESLKKGNNTPYDLTFLTYERKVVWA